MNIEWSKTKLGEVIILEYGKPLPRENRGINGKYPVFGANGEIDRTDKFLFDQPSIIVGRKGSAGEINLTGEKFWPLDVTYYIKYDRDHYDLYFLYYLLSNLQLTKLAKGVKPGINRNEVYSIEVYIPPLPEQQRIVEILDQSFIAIDQAIANTEKNLLNIRDLFESTLNKFDDDKLELGNFVHIRTGKLDANAANNDGAYPFFTCAKEIYRINEFAFDTEAILLAGNNAVGDFNVKHYKGRFNAYQRTYVITIRDSEKLLYKHLYYQLTKNLQLFKKQSVGANTKFLKIDMIKNIPISIPTIEKQKKIIEELDNLFEHSQNLENIYKRKLQLLDDLKQSILQKAFNGELT